MLINGSLMYPYIKVLPTKPFKGLVLTMSVSTTAFSSNIPQEFWWTNDQLWVVVNICDHHP